MPGTPTSRLGLPTISGATDLVSSYPAVEESTMETLDNAAMFITSTLSARPAASSVIAGTVHLASDVGVLAMSNGASWLLLSPAERVGEGKEWYGANDPVDPDGVSRWMICDGRAISRTTYAALFATIGTTHGTGDGSTTFNLPNGIDRVGIGAGSASGLTARALGATGGEENHALTSTENGPHGHTGTANSNSTGLTVNQQYADADSSVDGHPPGLYPGIGTSGFPAYGVASLFVTNSGGNYSVPIITYSGRPGDYANWGGSHLLHDHPVTDPQHSHVLSINQNGSGTGHNNMQPFLVLNHIIKVQY